MRRPGLTNERLVALFLLALLAFNPPLLTLFDVPEFVVGLPVLYVYLFAVWLLLILLMALTVESAATEVGSEESAAPDTDPPVARD